MENTEKHNNQEVERERDLLEAGKLKAHARNEARKNDRKVNKLWLWLGVLLLICILLWWLWSIGIFEDLTGVTNG